MTSIEWLIEKLGIIEMYEDSDIPLDNILEQAKEMHKQEIITAYNEGDTFPQSYYNGKHYYELTFKKY